MATSAARIDFDEGAAPASPAAAKVRIYAKADGLLYSKDDAGTETLVSGGGSGAVATDAIWDAAGDLAVGTGANTAAKLTIGASGTVPKSNGTTLAYAFPPGHEFDYVEKTSDTSITNTTEGAADTIVTGSAVTYDGSTVVLIEFFCARINPDTAAAGRYVWVVLYDGASSIGQWGLIQTPAAASFAVPIRLARRITPSAAAHTYSVRAFVGAGTATAFAGAGGNGATMPAFIRITKAT